MAKIDQAGFEIWGTSPKFLRALELSGYDNEFSFKNLEVILSTGAPLLPEQYDFVYKKIINNPNTLQKPIVYFDSF